MPAIGSMTRAVVCTRHNKLTFTTENEARLQLVRAQVLHELQGKLKIEKRYYPCDLGGFHLTSWEEQGTK